MVQNRYAARHTGEQSSLDACCPGSDYCCGSIQLSCAVLLLLLELCRKPPVGRSRLSSSKSSLTPSTGVSITACGAHYGVPTGILPNFAFLTFMSLLSAGDTISVRRLASNMQLRCLTLRLGVPLCSPSHLTLEGSFITLRSLQGSFLAHQRW